MRRGSKKGAHRGKATARQPNSSPAPSGGALEPRRPASGREGRPARTADRWKILGVCVSLALATWVVFGQTFRHPFVNFDDDVYVYENPRVARGLTLDGIVWAFTHTHGANWHPLTWVSHMLDCQLYGLNAGGHHVTSVLLHGAAVILLFLVLQQSTGALWRSTFVAAVFGLHPLHVESVAWVAERKDVLSGVFFILTLGAYVRYARHRPSLSRYLTVVLLFGLGLMGKPMLITLPFVLLLLDYWPLHRLTRPVAGAAPQPGWRWGRVEVPQRLIVEKIPLLALSAASCVTTLVAQSEAIRSFEEIALPLRIGNAVVSYAAYLGQMIYPAGLAPFYPYAADGATPWKVGGALGLLLFASVGAFVVRRRQPYVLVGWLWYLIMLAPVIGVVQVGAHARADRYTYLPQIGLYLLVAWAVADLSATWRRRRVVLGAAGIGVIASLVACARTQASYWRSSESLWSHTLACTANNSVAHNNLGEVVLRAGRVDEAIGHFKEALKVNPRNVFAYNNLGAALIQAGKPAEALAPFTKALEVDPNYADAHNGLGNALLQSGQIVEAAAQYGKALELNPDHVEAHNGLGNASLQSGRMDEAIAQYQRTLALDPKHADAHNGLGNALLRTGRVRDAIVQYRLALEIDPKHALSHNGIATALVQTGRMDEAIAHYKQALELNPDFAAASNNLAWVLATCPDAAFRDGAKAIELAERADHLSGGRNPVFLATLAAAYAESGRFGDAIQVARTVIELATAAGQGALANQTRDRLKLYESGRAFHENPTAPTS